MTVETERSALNVALNGIATYAYVVDGLFGLKIFDVSVVEVCSTPFHFAAQL